MPEDANDAIKFDGLAETVYRDLYKTYGVMVGGSALRQLLGYPTAAAMRRSVERGTLSLPTFVLPGLKGRFALTRELAQWIVKARMQAPDDRILSEAASEA